MSGVDPNRLINLALALAQRHTDETHELAAAHAAYDAETIRMYVLISLDFIGLVEPNPRVN